MAKAKKPNPFAGKGGGTMPKGSPEGEKGKAPAGKGKLPPGFVPFKKGGKKGAKK